MEIDVSFSQQNSTTIRHREVDARLQITLYIGIAILALPGNCILFYLSTFTNKLKMEGLSLLRNLAVSDILIICVGVPFTVANLSNYEGGTHDGILCQPQGFLILVLFLNSNFNIFLIAVYRFLFIVKNDVYQRLCGKTWRVNFSVCMTWFSAVCVSVPSVTGWGKLDYNFNRAHCMIVWRHSISYLLFVQFFAFLLPLIVVIFAYWRILNHFRASQVRTNVRRSDRKTCIMSAMITASFFLSFLPYAILIVHEGLIGELAGEVFSFIAMIFAYSNGVVDFWIYSYMNRSFRRSAGQMLLCCGSNGLFKLNVCHPRQARTSDEPITTQTSGENSSPRGLREATN